ncbi:Fre3p [Sugiyamaella lignohabitans]|uniref:ferric-chelate reductase (NADPH) n=1 Tax=Sugiyamaella lignohabitans TaxID=796027 RepID=A0A167BWN3_9ASCO|nr:Fre3p [Sugiyamaella lignohabitans]ANB10920.1 Fre3p [Sugiyamaella lignohabitans]
MLAFWGIIILFKSIHNLFHRMGPYVLKYLDFPLSRRLRAEFFLPPTGRYHHSTPKSLLGFTFNIPARIETIIISLFFIQNILLAFVGIETIENSVFYDSMSDQYADSIGYRAGVICMAELVLLIVFAGRNNLLIYITGWEMNTFNVFHKWVARMTAMQAVIHSIGYTIEYVQEDYYTEYFSGEPGTAWFIWGVVATILMCALITHSVHFFRSINYELFLYGHITLTAVAIAGVWLHVIGMEGMNYTYAAIAIWAFDHVARIVRLLWSGVTSKASMKLHGEHILEIKIDYSKRWKFYPGCHVYLHILRTNRFWQSHPFTVVTSPRPDDQGKLVIFARVKKGLTKHTANYLKDKPDQSAQVRVLVEGPYGGRHPLHHYETVVLIAGGVGITSIYPYAAQLRENKDKAQRMVFIWVIRNEQPLSWFQDQLRHISEDPRIEVILFITGSNALVSNEGSATSSTTNLDKSPLESEASSQTEKKSPLVSSSVFDIRAGTPDLRSRVAHDISEAAGTVAFLVCGPNRMNDDVRMGIVDNIADSKHRVDYFEDSFSW